MRICLIGGMRSGKSTHAQQLASAKVERLHSSTGDDSHPAEVLFVAFGKEGCDGEFDSRIAHHRSSRPAEWKTLELGEEPLARWNELIEDAVDKRFSVTVVDCVATLVSCIIDDILSDTYGEQWYLRETFDDDIAGVVARQAKSYIASLCGVAPETVFVTNEVGLAPIAPSPSGRLFVDSLGWVNQELSTLCDKTFLVVAGSAIDVTSLSTIPCWE